MPSACAGCSSCPALAADGAGAQLQGPGHVQQPLTVGHAGSAACTLVWSTGGRPSRVPFLRAVASPALVRSTSCARSTEVAVDRMIKPNDALGHGEDGVVLRAVAITPSRKVVPDGDTLT